MYQMKPANDREHQTSSYLSPDHPYIRRVGLFGTVSSVYCHSLFDSMPFLRIRLFLRSYAGSTCML